MQEAKLLGDVGFDKAGEEGHLKDGVGSKEQMHVITEEYEGEQFDVVLSLSPAEDAQDEVVYLGGGSEEKASMDGPGGNLDDSSLGFDRTKVASHDNTDRRQTPGFPTRKK